MRLGLVALVPAMAGAQVVSPTMSDASIVARGAVRFRGQVEWTRVDAIFGPDGKTFSLGSLLTTELHPGTLPLLAGAEIDTRILADSPTVALSLGRLQTTANSRIARVPLGVEYGLTSRITLGLMVPVVQTRTVVTIQLNGRADSTANLGVNPAGYFLQSSAFIANAQVTTGLDNASTQLSQRLATCTAAPASPGCGALLVRSAEANALIADAQEFSSAAGTLYGTSVDMPGAPFIPLAGTAIQQAIDARLAGLRTDFSSFGISGGSGALVGAKGLAANNELQSIIRDPAYGIDLDSIGTTQQISVGDIELSVTSRLFDSFARATPSRLKLRAAVAGVVRLGTGHPARPGQPFDVATGDGQMDLEVRGALDALVGRRLLTTAAATYTQQLGSVETARLPYSPDFLYVLTYPTPGSLKLGNMAAVRVNPRFMITDALMVGGLATAAYRGADVVTVTGPTPGGLTYGNPRSFTSWAGGFTISYSNLASATGTGGPGFPAEILFSHIETLGASDSGSEKTFRDTIEFRLYFRARR